LEASAPGSLIAACPAWKRKEKRREGRSLQIACTSEAMISVSNK